MKKSNIRSSVFSAFVCIIILASCQENKGKSSRVDRLPYYASGSFTPLWLGTNDKELDTLHKISDFELINQNGEAVTEKTFENKIYITDFFFTTCPGICPKMTANMSILQDTFLEDREVLLLSHSVTPEIDSVPVLKQYADDKGILAQKWHLVTGARAMIYNLGRKDYFVEEDLGLEMTEEDFLHTENFVLIDKNRHIRGIYNGLNKASVNQLIADVLTLKKE